MSKAITTRAKAAGWGEVPPTAGLPPRWGDLLGSGSQTLEQAVCALFGFDDVEIVSTGTAALVVAFTYLKERAPGRDVVIVPAYTCPLVVIAAHAAGLRAMACDTVAGGFDLDGAHLARLLDGRTLAVVPTHYGGALADVAQAQKALSSVSPDIAIVEDAAQAFGATIGGRSVGLAGDIGVFSFGVGKGFTIYEGGALVARDRVMLAGLREVARRLATGAGGGELVRALMLIGYHAVYNPLGLRLVYGAAKRRALAAGDDIGAAGDHYPLELPIATVGAWRKRVGAAALQRLPAHIENCARRFEAISERLDGVPGVRVHRPTADFQPLATFAFATLADHPHRAKLIDTLWRSRLGVCRLFSRALGDYPDIARMLLPTETPNARAMAQSTITISTAVGKRDLAMIAAMLSGVLRCDAALVGEVGADEH